MTNGSQPDAYLKGKSNFLIGIQNSVQLFAAQLFGKGISGLKGERNQKADQNQNSIVTPLGINQLAPLNSHPRWLPASPLSQFG